jgi:hypothetical protein
MNELLVQSPLPNYIHLFPFPSLPFLLDDGKIKGLSLIGATEIKEMIWKKSVNSTIFIESLVLEIDFSHFWWNTEDGTIVEKDDRPGFYSFNPRIEENTENKKQAVIVSPNSLKLMNSSCSNVRTQTFTDMLEERFDKKGYLSTVLGSKQFLKITMIDKTQNERKKKCNLHFRS